MWEKSLGRFAILVVVFVLSAAIAGTALWLGVVMPMYESSGEARLAYGLLWWLGFLALCLGVANIEEDL